MFDEDAPIELIKKIKPDFLVKGGDYKAENVIGYNEVKSYGGKTVIIPLVPNFSTTALLKKINS